MRLKIVSIWAHNSTLKDCISAGKLLQTGNLGVLLTPRGSSASITLNLVRERDGRLVATPLNLQFSLADRAAVNPSASRDSSDEDLVRAAQSGDRAAFGFLYERYARMVHGILLGRVPPSAVEDLVQDVFLRAMPRVASLREVDHFGGWLAAIARNRAADFFRHSPSATAPFEDSENAGPESKGGSSSDQAEAHAILAAIRTLPEAYRETLILRLVEGMTGPEIAERTGLTPASVRVNLHRGMKQLRQKLGYTEGL